LWYLPVIALAATCAMLTLMHRRQRLRAFHETRDYCYEQVLLRRSVLALRSDRARNGMSMVKPMYEYI
jgi:hypothetical protein